MIKQFYFKPLYLEQVNKVKWFQVLLCVTNNSMKHHSFIYTQLKHQAILFQTIQFSISHLFALNFNAKQFYLSHRLYPIRYYHFGPEWTWDRWQ